MTVPGSFNLADIWEMAADAVPEREALVIGTARRTYADLEERANRLAHVLAARGVGPGDHVALYMENRPEYLEGMLAAFKLRAVPINVNFRYVADELRYLLDNSDSVGVVTQPSLRGVVSEVLDLVPSVGFVLTTGDELDAALADASAERPEVERSGDDHYVIYTGGTTGLPKGVVWRQEDAFFACMGGGDAMGLTGWAKRPEELVERIVEHPISYLTVAPMVHAAAQWTAFRWLMCGGKVVLTSGSFDPQAVWRAVGDEGVMTMTVVGDAMARPLLDAWDAAGGYDISSLWAFSNGGAPLSSSIRDRVLATLPDVVFIDGFGSSEAGTQGAFRMTRADLDKRDERSGAVGYDQPAKPTIVVGDDGNELAPGSGELGHVLAGGHLPLGYYNDPDRTAAMFVEREGQRWLVTGDMATVAADGSIHLIGRGSGVINSGGEKVFPEEVEEVLKTHPLVYDCLVVGVPDERWGSAVAAVVQPAEGATVTFDDVAVHSKQHLAGYKAPKHMVVVDQVKRSPSGKADYRWAQRVVTDQMAR